jgi:phosphatidylglycerol:prolipoprotein diacylglycerol transferase
MRAPDPVAFTIFGFEIRWYGVLIATGVLLALIISCRRAPKHGLNTDNVLDIVIFSVPIGIIGARLYYVIFNFYMYRGDLSSIFDIRQGGLAIHGGLIAGLITAWFVCRHDGVRFLDAADLIFPTVALAQSIGRWGNFFNSEAHGTVTDVPWAIIVNGQHVHPTFLYESIWCLIIFFILIMIDNRRKFSGQTMCMYGMLYSPERFIVEGLRTDSLMIGPFRQAQVISVVIFVVCFILYRKLSRRPDGQIASPGEKK